MSQTAPLRTAASSAEFGSGDRLRGPLQLFLAGLLTAGIIHVAFAAAYLIAGWVALSGRGLR